MCIRDSPYAAQGAIAVFLNKILKDEEIVIWGDGEVVRDYIYIKDAANALVSSCLLYTSDAADERSSVDLGGRRIIKKKKIKKKEECRII